MENLNYKVAELEQRMAIMQGQNEILMGFVVSKFGKDDFMDYLKFVSESKEFYGEARKVAGDMLDHDKTWNSLLHSEPN